jgi:hypothetical protein
LPIYIKLRGIKRIKPSGLHNNSDCTDKVAALERDEADTATARTTVLIEKINIAEILRMNSEPARIFAFFPRFGKPSNTLGVPTALKRLMAIAI